MMEKGFTSRPDKCNYTCMCYYCTFHEWCCCIFIKPGFEVETDQEKRKEFAK